MPPATFEHERDSFRRQAPFVSQWIYPVLVCLILLVIAGPTGCGEDTTEEPTDEVDILITHGEVFATPEISVSSGTTLTIRNNDEIIHSVTSESAPGAFDNTGDFDVIVSAGSVGVLTVPAADAGDVFYFYCRLHEGVMTPADGQIVIE